MKALIFAAAVVTLMVLLGWITLNNSSHRATISVETDTIQHDLKQTADVVRDAASKGITHAKDAVRKEPAPVQP